MAAAKRILLLGKNGQLGRELQRSLTPLGEVIALARTSANYRGDLSDSSGIVDTIKCLRPHIIVNAAAYTAVDAAESNPEEAFLINGAAVDALAKTAREQNALLVHYSTDYVFNGTGTRAWAETDMPDPINVYGKSKLTGERAITNSGCRHLIFRTSWLYAEHGNNFVKTILQRARECSELRVVDDQIGAPTSAVLVADISAKCIQSVLERPQLEGLYHLAAKGHTNWHTFAKEIIAQATAQRMELKTHTENVIAINGVVYKTAAARPKNSLLDTTKIETAFNVTLPDWKDEITSTISVLAKR